MAWFPVWPFIHFCASLVYISLIIVILSKVRRGSKPALNYIAAALFSCFAVWSFGKMSLHNPLTPENVAFTLEKINAVAWCLFPALALLFITILSGNKKLLNSKIFYALIIILPLFFVFLHWTGRLMAAPVKMYYGWYSDWLPGAVWPFFYYFYYIGFIVLGMTVLALAASKSVSKSLKKQSDIILIFSALTLLVGTFFEVIMPLLKLPGYNSPLCDITNLYILIWAIGMFYAIFRHELLSITSATAADNIISNMSEALFLLDSELKIIYANTAAHTMLRYGDKELFTKFFATLLREKKDINKILKTALVQNSISGFETVLTRSNSTTVPVMLSFNTLSEAGDIKGFSCIATDITAQKKAETELKESYRKLKELDMMKTSFTSMVSHELRTPLTSIKGFLAFLLSGVAGRVNPMQKEFLETIRNNSERLLSLINDILDVSKMEAGNFTIDKKICNLIEIIGTSIKDIHSLAEKKSIKIEIQPAIENPSINADAYRLSQVVTNLISNAIKFSPQASTIKILVSGADYDTVIFPEHFARPALDCKCVLVSVADSGIGIKKEDLKNIFTRFFQVENINTRHAQGTGLGLSIAKNIIEAHGGCIWVNSEGEGKGAIFSFLLPVA